MTGLSLALKEMRENKVLIKYMLKAIIKSRFSILFNMKYDDAINMLFSKDLINIFGIEIIDDKLRFKFNGNYVYFYYNDLRNDGARLVENFIIRQYSKLNVNGKNVIDIGGYIGDSAIYFSLMGARHVFAYEPFPSSYKRALKNIELNNIKNISFCNAAVTDKKGTIKIRDSDSPYEELMPDGDIEIKAITLNEISCNKNNLVLKMDCEGCERKVIYSDLSKFDEIFIEYDFGYDYIIKRLKQFGFHYKMISRPYRINNRITGSIYAFK
ncbi:FkbM family methyltransferase [Picrophilus oshimae]|uniref:Methyltransferase FkbM domain-containing protein n=1 Tax=Picrophilus torridus (strain ATCC 700027 / DSM 9790 / JCM 10055 / NBRC 100828 / KAW 2/3) TaxID=1122961 RepID=Q6L2C1_PICTO|nr:FkbM family methyltransferase [Picrophilus oshimae]AAT42881.1 hypothetical protein PTO0296 [Picrophilus oshimae DSM 9789]